MSESFVSFQEASLLMWLPCIILLVFILYCILSSYVLIVQRIVFTCPVQILNFLVGHNAGIFMFLNGNARKVFHLKYLSSGIETYKVSILCLMTITQLNEFKIALQQKCPWFLFTPKQLWTLTFRFFSWKIAIKKKPQYSLSYIVCDV